MLYSFRERNPWKVCGGGQRELRFREESVLQNMILYSCVGRHNLSVSVSLTVWWTHVAVNYKSLYCVRLCCVDCRKVDDGNINEKAVTFSKTTQSPESLSYTNTAQIYMMSLTSESQPSALSKKGWGLNASKCSDYENIHCVAEICHVTTNVFVLDTDHRANSPYRDRGCLCTWYFKGLTILGKPLLSWTYSTF